MEAGEPALGANLHILGEGSSSDPSPSANLAGAEGRIVQLLAMTNIVGLFLLE